MGISGIRVSRCSAKLCINTENCNYSFLDFLRTRLALGKNLIECRVCRRDHWTYMCPQAGGDVSDNKSNPASTSGGDSRKALVAQNKGVYSEIVIGTYVPPRMTNQATSGMAGDWPIRINNLSSSTTEIDLKDLTDPFGPRRRVYLAKDTKTGLCKGFAYIHFNFREDAATAISTLNGLGFDHLILNVDWVKPSSSLNK